MLSTSVLQVQTSRYIPLYSTLLQ